MSHNPFRELEEKGHGLEIVARSYSIKEGTKVYQRNSTLLYDEAASDSAELTRKAMALQEAMTAAGFTTSKALATEDGNIAGGGKSGRR